MLADSFGEEKMASVPFMLKSIRQSNLDTLFVIDLEKEKKPMIRNRHLNNKWHDSWQDEQTFDEIEETVQGGRPELMYLT